VDASRVVLTDNNDRVLDLLRRNVDANFTRSQCESIVNFTVKWACC